MFFFLSPMICFSLTKPSLDSSCMGNLSRVLSDKSLYPRMTMACNSTDVIRDFPSVRFYADDRAGCTAVETRRLRQLPHFVRIVSVTLLFNALLVSVLGPRLENLPV